MPRAYLATTCPEPGTEAYRMIGTHFDECLVLSCAYGKVEALMNTGPRVGKVAVFPLSELWVSG